MPAEFPRFAERPEGPARWWLETRVALAFLTRIPVPHDEAPATPLAQAARGFPVAGLVVGIGGAVMFALGEVFTLPSLVASLLAIAVMVLLTGGLHEDGLADTADGLGGGRDRDHALAIMRDSRIGSFGVIALVIGTGLRAAAINALGYPDAAGVAIIAAACASRAVLPVMMLYLPSARPDGLAQAAGTPERRAVIEGGILAALVVFLCLGFVATLILAGLFALSVILFMRYLHHRLGGQTGDTLGAAQQGCEILVLLVATTVLP
jgi:adenosylcobinamide-GDP ribazoletransferase